MSSFQCSGCQGKPLPVRDYPSLWWMSFADPRRPRGDTNLGVVILDVPVGADPIRHSHAIGVNPGGEVAFAEVIGESQALYTAAFRNRLLAKAELVAAGFIDA